MFGYVLIGTIAGVVCFPVSYLFVQPLLLSLLRCSSVVSVVTVFVPICLSSSRRNPSWAGSTNLMKKVRTALHMPSSGTLSACFGKLIRLGRPDENVWDQAQLLAHIAALETELARYVAKYGLTPEARRLFALPPLPRRSVSKAETGYTS
jgi:hypothetical protein